MDKLGLLLPPRQLSWLYGKGGGFWGSGDAERFKLNAVYAGVGAKGSQKGIRLQHLPRAA